MNSIDPLAPVNPSAPTSTVKISREGREHNLRVDQTVHGSVAEGGQERALLELGSQRLWAETNIPLKTGQHLTFRVVATSPRLELRLVEDLLAERLGGFLHLLGEPWNLKPALQGVVAEGPIFARLSAAAQKVLTALLDFQGGTAATMDGRFLKEFLQKLGLDMERRFASHGEGQKADATLKSALLEVRHLASRDPSAAGRAAERLLQNLELFQLCQVRLAQQGMLLLPLPLPFLEHGYLIVEEEQPGAEEKGKGPRGFSLHLSLRGLGDLRVDFLREPQGLFLRFVCESQEKIDFISPFLEELKTALGPFPLRGITFATGVEDPAKTLLKKVLAEGDAMLDTRV